MQSLLILSLFLVYYRFDRSNALKNIDTSVSTMYGLCGENNNHCTLLSAVTNGKLKVTRLLGNEPLNTNSNCTVNFVEIIHNCIPGRVPLTLFFKSYHHKLYLKV